jgi:ABC-2 type transport system ATP-binding protein
MLIDANHLKLSLNDAEILQDISLHLAPDEIYGLLGPNGAGKSTTIAVLLGLYRRSGGDLQLFDETSADPRAVRQRIGVMPERAGFYGWMSSAQYLMWYASFYGGLQQPVAELLRLVGLRDRGDEPLGRFSHGMRQRLALARALAHGPELLILDEPTNGLDPRGRREIHDLLLQLTRERRVGILLCTHLLDDVERLCSRVGIIDRGRTVAESTLAELLGEDHQGAVRYRLRPAGPLAGAVLPRGIELLRRDGEWWDVAIAADVLPQLPRLWEQLLRDGWGITEIHAEGGGLEALYLRLRAATERDGWEEAA